jgi:hypothetical protein
MPDGRKPGKPGKPALVEKETELSQLPGSCFAHDLFRKPGSTLGSSPRASFFGIMRLRITKR